MERCEFIEKCGFFLNYKGNTEVLKYGWVKLYCENRQKSETCQRKMTRKKTGSPPPDNMAPTGKMLPTL